MCRLELVLGAAAVGGSRAFRHWRRVLHARGLLGGDFAGLMVNFAVPEKQR